METVNTLGDKVDEATVGDDGRAGRSRRPRRARRPVSTQRPRRARRPRPRFLATVGALACLLAAGTVLLGAPIASAATTTGTADGTMTGATADAADAAPAAQAPATQAPAPMPFPQLGTLPPETGTPTPAPSDRPAVRPTIADPGDVTTATVRLHGRGTPGHRVRVGGPSAAGPSGCTTTVSADGTWACIAAVRSGPHQVFTVSDGSDPALGSSSAPASDVIVPPTIATSGPTTGPVSGDGSPGATVSVTVAGSTLDRTATVGSDGRWTVSLAGSGVREGRVTLSAAQTASTARGYRSDLRSAPSAPRTVVLDRSAPAAPVISAPGRGERIRSQPFTLRGTGEAGAVVTAYLDRAPICRSTVGADRRWTCAATGTAAAGTRSLTATQQDGAGNSSPSSASVPVLLSGPAAGSTGGPTAGASGAAADPDPTSAPTADASTGTAGHGHGAGTDGERDNGTGKRADATAGAGAAGGTAGGTGAGSGPGAGTSTGTTPGGSRAGVPDWSGRAGDWAAGTTYDRGVPAVQTAFSWSTVLLATGAAAGFLLLVAAPLALVGTAARGRLRWPRAALLGRNRSRADRRLGDDVLPTWAVAAVSVGIVGVTTLLGVGVSLEARYIRLALAVLLGGTVTTAAVVLATRWAAGADRSTVGFRTSPWLVLAALVGCLLTRTADLSPALVVGAVLVPVGRPGADTTALRLGSTLASGVRGATARSVALLALAAAGWAVHSVTHGSGFWTSFVSEFATTLCVGAVGAVVVSLVPLPGSTGAVLVAEARPRYVGLTVCAVALAAIVAGGPGPAPSPAQVGTAAGLSAVAVVLTWAWLRRPPAGQRAQQR